MPSTDTTYGEAITDMGPTFGKKHMRISASGRSAGSIAITEQRRGEETSISMPLNLAQIDEQIAALTALRKDIVEHGNPNLESAVDYLTADDISAWRATENANSMTDTDVADLHEGDLVTIPAATGPRYGSIKRIRPVADSFHIELDNGAYASVKASSTVPAIPR